MADGTAADYALLDRHEQAHAAGLADRILVALEALSDSLGGYRVTRLEHSLQTATRARRDGADVDWVVAALVHDLGDDLAPFNHGAFAASVLEPYVREEVTWVVRHHGVFQAWYYAHHLGGDRHARDSYAGHEWAPLCVDFCERWDQRSFDPDSPTDDLASFGAEVREVFGRTAWAPEVVAPGTRGGP
ncbi:MAG: HD domain-containing protein [Actinomycetota bacterium]